MKTEEYTAVAFEWGSIEDEKFSTIVMLRGKLSPDSVIIFVANFHFRNEVEEIIQSYLDFPTKRETWSRASSLSVALLGDYERYSDRINGREIGEARIVGSKKLKRLLLDKAVEARLLDERDIEIRDGKEAQLVIQELTRLY